MAIQCIARRMSGGKNYEHIAKLRCQDEGSQYFYDWPIETVVQHVEKYGEQSMFCLDPKSGKRAYLYVVEGKDDRKWVRTKADDVVTDNLLQLQTF